jgi:hypothetical protein
MWGSGNAGYGVLMQIGGKLSVPSNLVPKVTGALGDIGLASTNSSIIITTAQTYVASSGAYGPLQTLNWNTFSNVAIFNFSAFRPSSDIAVLGGFV